MIGIDAASVLLQWASGGMLFLWLTIRADSSSPLQVASDASSRQTSGRPRVSKGYGWLLRSIYLTVAIGSLISNVVFTPDLATGLFIGGLVVLIAISLARSIFSEAEVLLDLAAALIGFLGLIWFGIAEGQPAWLAVSRLLIGAAFIGVVSDAMLLGHWYLVQPKLGRAPINELVKWCKILWAPEVILWLLPTGMVSVWTGEISDGYAGMLGWFWGACVVTTLGLFVMTSEALKEKQYSAVMAATGLLYLTILTGFGIDLVARAVLGTSLQS